VSKGTLVLESFIGEIPSIERNGTPNRIANRSQLIPFPFGRRDNNTTVCTNISPVLFDIQRSRMTSRRAQVTRPAKNARYSISFMATKSTFNEFFQSGLTY